ncbi:MAG: trehalose-phosphatase, partial [Candidatus Omnitrophica bacterium]|nr:trehalose-phosphatase [Candidatus Omnitrophota bacterium]
IAETPAKAILSKETRRMLRRVSRSRDCSLAIVSGRALKQVRRMVGLKGIIYAGNHGLEIEGPRIRFELPDSDRFKKTIKDIKKALEKNLSRISGVLIEDKGLTLSLHYRLVKRSGGALLKNLFFEVIRPYTLRNKVKVAYGKKVFEIRPPVDWNKGRAVMWLLARERFRHGKNAVRPIYIGDDVTDEDAFVALGNRALTIMVGANGYSHARYYVRDPKETKDFLNRILKEKAARCRKS